ncbi:TerD family protein [Rathayibacter rathayi]|uniref:TerD family protein n=1 Tax=Rathayibacter rathayi TaxID=33887 RepID=UPI000CE7985A|nr:TerD family protein [Rathayibacter rathayi]PPG14400.1 stress protein [Rathayibacter rathayi]
MTITLDKGDSFSLDKPDGSPLTRVVLGLGWDPQDAPAATKGLFGLRRQAPAAHPNIDLDASVLFFDGAGKLMDTVAFNRLCSRDGSTQHTGDNLTGAGDGDGDDEQIIIDLSRVDPKVKNIVAVITSYSGHRFSAVKNTHARVLDASGSRQEEVVRFDLADGGDDTGNVVARFRRGKNGWSYTAIGASARGRAAKDLVPAAQAHL